MKRTREYTGDDVPSLPTDLWCRIIALSGEPRSGLVCREWLHLVTNRDTSIDWFDVLQCNAQPHLDEVLRMTGSGFTPDTGHTMTLAQYLDEVESHFTYRHYLCGLRQRLSLFLVNALRIFTEGREKAELNYVNRTCLLQSALYYLRDVKHKPLAVTNFHPRDFRINFFEEGHTYLLAMWHNGRWCLATNIVSAVPEIMSEELTSGTAMNHDLFEPFVEDEVAERMVRSAKHKNPDQKTEYFDLSVEEIKAKWAEARRLGTAWHYNVECYCNGLEYETGCREWELLEPYEEEWVRGRMVPYRTEWMMYDEELRLTGSDDIIYQDVEGGGIARTESGALVLHMADWKRANDLLKDNPYQCGTKPCTEDMPDTKISHYRVQLLVYTILLERNYDVFVARRSIIGTHPSQEAYIKYDVLYEEKRVKDLIAYRKQWLKEREMARDKKRADVKS